MKYKGKTKSIFSLKTIINTDFLCIMHGSAQIKVKSNLFAIETSVLTLT